MGIKMAENDPIVACPFANGSCKYVPVADAATVKTGIDEKLYFEHLYKEYATVSERISSYTVGSFEDFKLLAALGAIFAWQPLSEILTKNFQPGVDAVPAIHPQYVLFMGFLAISLVASIIEMRDLLKHSIIRFYLIELRILEGEILKVAERPEALVFHSGRSWSKWFDEKHKFHILMFELTAHGSVILFPTIILHLDKANDLAIGYFGISLALAAMVFLGFRRMRG
jgi:hypothetical protein